MNIKRNGTMTNIQRIVIVSILFVIISFLFSKSVYSASFPGDSDNVGSGGEAQSEEIEIWRYKQAIDGDYPDLGYENVDFIVSNRNIRYPAWKIGKNVPGYVHVADMSATKESIMEYGYVENLATGDIKSGLNGQIKSVILYLHYSGPLVKTKFI